MRVYIIGAGPGDPRLLTLRAAELIAACPVVLYTGSLVPREALARTRHDAEVLDSSSMTLDEIMSIIAAARDADRDVARVHTGDPLIFGSTAEQMRRMHALGIPYEIVPGVSSFTAAAAVLGRELTLPELSQTVILTRAEGRTPVPDREKLEDLARHRATLALFLSITLIKDVTRALIPSYGADCPVAVVHKATCPDQQIVTGTLADIREKVRAAGIRSQSIILVGRVLTASDFAESRLYDPTFTHRFRKARKPKRRASSEAQPLRARRILVARARPRPSEIATELRALGARVFEAPEIAISKASDEAALTRALGRLNDYDALVFGCAAGVDAVRELVTLGAMPIIAIGREPQRALERFGVTAAIRVDGACREILEACAPELQGRHLLLVTSDSGRPTLRSELIRLGARVDDVTAYTQVSRMIHERLSPIDLVVLPSSSAARAVLGHASGKALLDSPMLAIGPRTEAEARKYGAARVMRSETDTKSALIASVLAMLGTS